MFLCAVNFILQGDSTTVVTLVINLVILKYSSFAKISEVQFYPNIIINLIVLLSVKL